MIASTGAPRKHKRRARLVAAGIGGYRRGVRVVFLSPRYPPEMRQFTRGLAEVGAEVLGVGDGSPEPELRRYLADYLEVPSLLDEDDVVARVHAASAARTLSQRRSGARSEPTRTAIAPDLPRMR